MTFVNVVLWIYIGLLVAGGLVGYMIAHSKVSLIMAGTFAIALALCNLGIIRPFFVAQILVGVLIVTFLMRLVKTRKFMPSGMMLLLSGVTLGLLFAGK